MFDWEYDRFFLDVANSFFLDLYGDEYWERHGDIDKPTSGEFLHSLN
jgi:hypothetical protein